MIRPRETLDARASALWTVMSAAMNFPAARGDCVRRPRRPSLQRADAAQARFFRRYLKTIYVTLLPYVASARDVLPAIFSPGKEIKLPVR